MASTSTRVAFVSGGSSGIGYGLAEALLTQGYAVTISARTPSKLASAAEQLAVLGDVHHVAADFSSAEQITEAIASHRKRFGRLDVLVNNAGVGVAQPIADISEKMLDLQLGVNLRSYLLTTSAAVGLLRNSPAGHILNMSSIVAVRGRKGLAAYSASKAGIVAFTQSLQEELGPEGIKATALCPAFVETAMTDWIGEEEREAFITVNDIVTVVMAILQLSPNCNIPLVVFEPPIPGKLIGLDR